MKFLLITNVFIKIFLICRFTNASDTTTPLATSINSSTLASSSGSIGLNSSLLVLDAYVNVDCDEYHIGQTVTRPKTCTPVWNEDYQVRFYFFCYKI